MKIFKKNLLTLLLIVICSLSFITVSYAKDLETDKIQNNDSFEFYQEATIRNCDYLNLRSESSTKSQVLAKILPTETFFVVDQIGSWLKVEYNNMSGYVFWKYVKFIEPEIGDEETNLLGNSIIHYKSSSNRDINISIACDLINGTVIQPDECFKWSSVVGKTTAEKGFVSAPIIVNKKVTSGLGGGVCQVSTTLYNATFDTNLEIVKRFGHSIGCSYAEKDATVAYGYKDFIFKNTYDFPIKIEAHSYKSVVFVDIYKCAVY